MRVDVVRVLRGTDVHTPLKMLRLQACLNIEPHIRVVVNFWGFDNLCCATRKASGMSLFLVARCAFRKRFINGLMLKRLVIVYFWLRWFFPKVSFVTHKALCV